MAVPCLRTIVLPDVNGIPHVIGIEAAISIEVSVVFPHDDARSGCDSSDLLQKVLGPIERPRRKIRSLMVVSVIRIVRTAAAVEIQDLIWISRVVIYKIGSPPKTRTFEAGSLPDRPEK